MCLIYVAWRRDPTHRLVVAANRDESHARAAAPAHWWDDPPGVLAGRDLVAGGTWLGLTREGRVAAITNYHDPANHRADAPSRGALVTDFLTGTAPAPEFLHRVMSEGSRYNGFSLLAMDGETLAYASNRAAEVVRLEPGVYGLSNHLLDTPWPKVTSGKADLERLVARGRLAVPELLELLAPHRPADSGTSVADSYHDPERSRRNASRFILGGAYGTRTSTVVLVDAEWRGVFVERSFDARGRITGDVAFELGARDTSRRAVRDSRLDRMPVRPAPVDSDWEEARDGS